MVMKNISHDAYHELLGTNIVKELSDRTYRASFEEISFDKNGIRLPNYVMKQFNFTSGFFEVCFLFMCSLVKWEIDGKTMRTYIDSRTFYFTTAKDNRYLRHTGGT